MDKSVVIMAGGTGGHIFPGLALAEYVRKHSEYPVYWLGAQGLETRLVPAANIPLHSLPFYGVRGKGWMRRFITPWRLLSATWQAYRYLRQVQAGCVIGFGGFASFPGALAAYLAGIPLIVHEQNAVAGLSNRVSAKMARKVFSAFPCQLKNAEVIGNPVRNAFRALPEPEQRFLTRQKALNVLVLGGSQGARFINQLMPSVAAQCQQPLHIYHQTGAALLNEAQAIWQTIEHQHEVILSAFIEDMPQALANADIVICRSGALTVSELAAAGVASVLIPFPAAVDDHQTKNAYYLVDVHAAKLMPQTTLTANVLAEFLTKLTRETCLQMAKQARSLPYQNSAAKLAETCFEYMGCASLNHKNSEG